MKNCLLLLILAPALAASSFADYYRNTYTFNFSDPSVSYQINNVYILESRQDPNHYDYGFRLPGLQLTSPNSGSISDFANILTAPATSSLIIAETSELPGDATGQKHILIGMENGAASLAEDIAWGTLFRNTLEENIMYGLEHYADPDQTVTQQALQYLVDFGYGDAKTGILDNQAQSHSAWFKPGGTFTFMSWSNGQILGTGTSVQTSVVPEPATLACMTLGAIGLLKRRKKGSATRA